jgi:hypothetical protein
MTIVIIIVVAALFAALFLVTVSHRRAVAIKDLDDLAGHTRPVDIQAFRNLTDRAETEFLRTRLSWPHFHIVHRERTLAAAEYVRNVAHNASVLMRLGQAARESADPDVARAGADMVQRALMVRMIAMRVLVKLYIQSMIPGMTGSSQEILERYNRLTESATLFTRLQRPAFAGRVSAML